MGIGVTGVRVQAFGLRVPTDAGKRSERIGIRVGVVQSKVDVAAAPRTASSTRLCLTKGMHQSHIDIGRVILRRRAVTEVLQARLIRKRDVLQEPGRNRIDAR